MKILITGGEGFVGKKLRKQLIDKNHEVIEIDLKNGGDILNWNNLKMFPKFDLVFHLAARSFVPDSYKYPHDFYNVNCIGTLNIIELCRRYNSKMIYVSSYVYGKPDYLPIDENHPVKPFNPYAQSKIVAENICLGYSRDFGIPVIIVRPFNIYGPGQSKLFLIPQIISQVCNGKISIRDPLPKRDYIYINDFIRFLTLLVNFHPNSFEIFNVSSQQSYSVLEIVNLISDLNGVHPKIEITGSDRINEINDTLGSFEKAEKILNWKPKYSLTDGIKEML